MSFDAELYHWMLTELIEPIFPLAPNVVDKTVNQITCFAFTSGYLETYNLLQNFGSQ